MENGLGKLTSLRRQESVPALSLGCEWVFSMWHEEEAGMDQLVENTRSNLRTGPCPIGLVPDMSPFIFKDVFHKLPRWFPNGS